MPSTSNMHIELVQRPDGWHVEFVADDGTVYAAPGHTHPSREAAQSYVDMIVAELRQIPGAVEFPTNN